LVLAYLMWKTKRTMGPTIERVLVG